LGGKKMRRFRKFRDDRFALTTLQNPTIEVRTHAELVAAGEREREILQQASASAVIEAIPPPPPSPQPRQSQDSVAANAAPPLEKKLTPRPKRKARPRKKSTPHRHARRRRYTARRRKSAPNPANQDASLPADLDSAAANLLPVAAVPDEDIDSDLEPEYEDPNLPAPERHARKCVICHHPDRVRIEADFLNWRNADLISNHYDLHDYRPIYRHARATGLFQQRRANLRFAAELIIEHADSVVPTAEGVLRAIRASARINDDGQWVEPPSHVIVSTGGRVAAPMYGPLPQISMTQVVLPPPIPPPPNAQPQIQQPPSPHFEFVPAEVAQFEVPSAQLASLQAPASHSSATAQLGPTDHAGEAHPNLIGHTAIRNRRKSFKTTGVLQF
jgi:hypothetical protein